MQARKIQSQAILTSLDALPTMSLAFQAGFIDGLEWDLDGFETREDLLKATTGWDEATINAIGQTTCAESWGVDPSDSDAWSEACKDYNAGAHQGALWTPRTGKGPLYG